MADRHVFGDPLLIRHALIKACGRTVPHLAVVHPGVLLLELLGFSHQSLQKKNERKKEQVYLACWLHYCHWITAKIIIIAE